MKKIQMTLVFAMLVQTLSSQTDNSWYIRNDMVRDGQTYKTTTGPLQKILIKDIKRPVPSEGHSDDIFVIFEDGSYYNSRNHERNQPWHFESFGQNDKIYLNGNGKTIKYLYWTDKYTQDPPPTALAVGPYDTAPRIDNIIPPSTFYSTGRVSSIHDIVPEKDYTLIVSLEADGSYNDTEINLRRIHDGESKSYLNWNENLFSISPVFNGKYAYPDEPHYNESTGVITIAKELKDALLLQSYSHMYINLRPTSHLIDNFLSSHKRVAINTLAMGTDDELIEAVRIAHDPNHLIGKSICDNEGNRYVYYTGDFKNDGDAITPGRMDFYIELPHKLSGANVQVRNLRFGRKLIPVNEYAVATSGNIATCQISTQNGLAFDNTQDARTNPESVATFEICIGPISGPTELNIEEYKLQGGAVKFYVNSKIEEPFVIIDATFKTRDSIYWVEVERELDIVKVQKTMKIPVIESCEICGKPIEVKPAVDPESSSIDRLRKKNNALWIGGFGVFVIGGLVYSEYRRRKRKKSLRDDTK